MVSSKKFHEAKQSPAVLKHAILEKYAEPFVSKTGSTSLDHRVAIIDGYAGPGRYEDGSEGSGAMLLRTAHKVSQYSRRMECHFVENDPAVLRRLRNVAGVDGVGVTYTISDGDISTHLPALLQRVEGIPLFAYLDPCGLIIPFDEVVSIFNRPAGPGSPATEVLINLTAHLRRFAGMLTSDTPIESSLQRIDAVCGGSWWRDAWLDKCPNKNATEEQKSAAEEAVVHGYASKLRERAKIAGTWVIDVRRRADLKPVYYLVFATRHIDGMRIFGESASLALETWRKYHAEAAAEDTLFSKSWEQDWKEQEKILMEQWVNTIAARLTDELAKGQTVRIIEHPDAILGELIGVVRTKHLRAAIAKVHTDERTTTSPKRVDDLWNLAIEPT